MPTRNPISRLSFFALASLATVTGCASSGLDLKLIQSTAGKPSNVAVYFAVDRKDGSPVAGLEADDFRIYEDEGLVSEFESKQTILNPEVAAVHYTLLLVDMSGSVVESGQVPAVVQAADAFTQKLDASQKVAVYAFDGSTELYPIVRFTGSEGAAQGGVRALERFQPKDPSTNLHGAVVKGIELLEGELARATPPLRFGTLVVFTDGTDRAGRVSTEQMKKSLDGTSYEVFAIGLGAEISKKELEKIGKSGTAMAENKEQVVAAFEQVAQKIEAHTKRYYLLSYCTPARAGEHEVRIEAHEKDEQGNTKRKGNLRYKFKADSFSPNCDPNTPPSFDIKKGDALAGPGGRSGKPGGSKASVNVGGSGTKAQSR